MPALVTAAFASNYLLAMAGGNLGGRLFWSVPKYFTCSLHTSMHVPINFIWIRYRHSEENYFYSSRIFHENKDMHLIFVPAAVLNIEISCVICTW